MKITINDHRRIFAVQQEFHQLFPHLKIEFLGKPSNAANHASQKVVPASKTLGECRAVHTKGELTLTPSMTIADLKQALNDVYGLCVEVLIKSGFSWTYPSENGRLSLEEQNRIY